MKIVWLVLILSLKINAQIIEGISFSALNHFPHTTLKMSGVGSRGFDEINDYYNPHYDFDSSLSVSISGLINSQVIRNYYDLYEKKELRYLKNNIRILPEGNLKFKLGRSNAIQLSINYFTEVLSSQKLSLSSGSISFQFMTTDNNIYEVDLRKDEVEFYSISRTLQAAISFLIADSTSMSLGIQSTAFEHVYHWTPIEPWEFTTNMFENTQFLISVNHKFNHRLSGYINFKSQDTRNEMTKKASFQGKTIMLPETYLSLHGNISYGLQWKLSEKIKTSIEFSHQFIEVDEENIINGYTEKLEHSIWNNEIILGTKVTPTERLEVGLMFSTFLKFDNEVYMLYQTGLFNEYAKINPSKIFSLIGSLRFTLSIFTFTVYYQHSQAQYINEPRKTFDYGNFIKVNIAAKIPFLTNIY